MKQLNYLNWFVFFPYVTFVCSFSKFFLEFSIFLFSSQNNQTFRKKIHIESITIWFRWSLHCRLFKFIFKIWIIFFLERIFFSENPQHFFSIVLHCILFHRALGIVKPIESHIQTLDIYYVWFDFFKNSFLFLKIVSKKIYKY